MGLIIKFFYLTFIMPPGIYIVFLLGVVVLLWKKYHLHTLAKIMALFVFGFYITTTPLLADAVIRSLETRYYPPYEVKGDVIIMLGGGATADTPNISTAGHLSGSAANRLLTCAQLYRMLHVPIILSGGQVLDSTGCEAEIARAILLNLGIPDQHIIVENKSFNTTENARYSKEYIDQYGYKYPLLVTSAFHMERAIKQFHKVGVQVTSYPTDYQTNTYSSFHLLQFCPSANALHNFQLALKEYVGLAAAQWY